MFLLQYAIREPAGKFEAGRDFNYSTAALNTLCMFEEKCLVHAAVFLIEDNFYSTCIKNVQYTVFHRFVLLLGLFNYKL